MCYDKDKKVISKGYYRNHIKRSKVEPRPREKKENN